MKSFLVLFLVYSSCEQLSFATKSNDNAVSMVWYSAGKGCFKYNFYYLLKAKNRDDCIKRCQDDVRCAMVAYGERKHKCGLCSKEKYTHTTSCPYHVEIIAKDVNECAIRTDNCGENSVCVNKPGSFKCRCKNGYYRESGSKECIEAPDVEWIAYEDSCLEVTSFFAISELSNVEKCKLKCQIRESCAMVEYASHSKKCRMSKDRKFKPVPSCKSRTDLFVKAIIECDDEERKCPEHAYCHAKGGNRFCRCRFGYKGNGKVCRDVKECDTYKHLCGKHAKCRNTIGSYRCVCMFGYHGDGQICRKDKVDKEDIALFEEKHRGTFRTIVNFFGHSGSHHIAASSQTLIFFLLFATLIIKLCQ